VGLFDFDGTISLIRSGWVEIMVPMMVEILMELHTGESEADLRALVDEFVARLTGEQTIFQMMELARQVELRGGKPLEPLVYKRMYHDKLDGEYRVSAAGPAPGRGSAGEVSGAGSARFPRLPAQSRSEVVLCQWHG
jgi:phosphoglycolate phosphatase